jgi:hypothetical protein
MGAAEAQEATPEEEHIDERIAAEAEAAGVLEDRLDKLTAALSVAAAAGLAERINAQIPRCGERAGCHVSLAPHALCSALLKVRGRLREMLHARQMEAVRLMAAKKRLQVVGGAEGTEPAGAAAEPEVEMSAPDETPNASNTSNTSHISNTSSTSSAANTSNISNVEAPAEVKPAAAAAGGQQAPGTAVETAPSASAAAPTVSEASASASDSDGGGAGGASGSREEDVVLLGYAGASRRGAAAAQAGDTDVAVKCFLHCPPRPGGG